MTRLFIQLLIIGFIRTAYCADSTSGEFSIYLTDSAIVAFGEDGNWHLTAKTYELINGKYLLFSDNKGIDSGNFIVSDTNGYCYLNDRQRYALYYRTSNGERLTPERTSKHVKSIAFDKKGFCPERMSIIQYIRTVLLHFANNSMVKQINVCVELIFDPKVSESKQASQIDSICTLLNVKTKKVVNSSAVGNKLIKNIETDHMSAVAFGYSMCCDSQTANILDSVLKKSGNDHVK